MSFDHPHWVDITIDNYGPHMKFHCLANEGASCRMVCVDDHCQLSLGDMLCNVPSHKRDYGECVAKPFLDDLGFEAYGGPTDHPLYSGPIKIIWDFDGPQWEYLDAHPVFELARLYRKVMERKNANDRGATTASVGTGDQGRGMSSVQSTCEGE